MLDLAVEHSVIERRGAFFAYGEERLGRGRANVKEALEGRPDLVEEITRAVRERVESLVVDAKASFAEKAAAEEKPVAEEKEAAAG